MTRPRGVPVDRKELWAARRRWFIQWERYQAGTIPLSALPFGTSWWDKPGTLLGMLAFAKAHRDAARYHDTRPWAFRAECALRFPEFHR